MDLLVYRSFKEKDGLPNVGKLPRNGAKPYSCFYPRLIELQKEYARDLLTHVNPYTGKALTEDPGPALINYNSENDLFNSVAPIVVEPYRSYLLERFREWSKLHRPEVMIPDDYSFDFQGREPDELILHFYCDMQKEYYNDMDGFLRSIGVKIPVCGNPWARGLTLVSAMEDMDYTCANVY